MSKKIGFQGKLKLCLIFSNLLSTIYNSYLPFCQNSHYVPSKLFSINSVFDLKCERANKALFLKTIVFMWLVRSPGIGYLIGFSLCHCVSGKHDAVTSLT